jgi:hypothetical protein
MQNGEMIPVPWAGYEHLHPLDQPHSGINQLCEGQLLWRRFHYERTIRTLHAWQRDESKRQMLDNDFARIDSLPLDR